MCQRVTYVIFVVMEVKDIIENGGNYFLPNLSIDLVIIGYEQGKLKCLLLRLGEKWVLPGGYIGKQESVDAAAINTLKLRTGLDHAHLKFLDVFGASDRQFGADFKYFFEKNGLPWKKDSFINQRFVTLSYYSLVDIATTYPVPGEFDEEVAWFSFDKIPSMWLDHGQIVETARQRLKEDIKHEHVTYNLLPDAFTMPQLHTLHQAILEERVDRSRFQKKMLSSGIFERLPQLKKESPGRNPYLYKLK